MSQRTVTVGGIEIANGRPFAVIAGPCQIESLDHALMMADRIAAACEGAGRPFIYKSSYDKANRSSHATARGVGMEEGLGSSRR
jgi:2-dehydro-3-deoxyphosphooctonate aldolase (KDO 8-P synthase)